MQLYGFNIMPALEFPTNDISHRRILVFLEDELVASRQKIVVTSRRLFN